MTFTGLALIVWSLLCATVFSPLPENFRRFLSAAVPPAGITAMIIYGPFLSPGLRLLLGSVGLLYLMKASLLLRLPFIEVATFSKIGLLLYMSVWPGMEIEPFRERKQALSIDGRSFVRGYVLMIAGIASVCALALASPYLGNTVVGWAGIAALLLTIHFGYAQVLTGGMRLLGWDVQPLFDAPLASSSLSDFWSRRWNRPFVEMNKALFLAPLRSALGPATAVLAVFVLSGILHEVAISYPAGSHWGLPLVYFVIQGAAVLVERKLPFVQSPISGRVWTWAALLLPVPLLFHQGFRSRIIESFVTFLHDQLTTYIFEDYLSAALWLAALGHLLVLVASFQVPKKLNWHEELQRLSPFNRKIMWNYGGYIVGFIISFAALTAILHDEILAGEKGALCVAFLIAAFWAVRVLVDLFYFGHRDWPEGPEFVVGHTLLTSLFLFLTAVYATALFRHLL